MWVISDRLCQLHPVMSGSGFWNNTYPISKTKLSQEPWDIHGNKSWFNMQNHFLVPGRDKRGTFLRAAFEHPDEWGKRELQWTKYSGGLKIIGIISEMFAQNTSLSKIIFVAYQALTYASLYYVHLIVWRKCWCFSYCAFPGYVEWQGEGVEWICHRKGFVYCIFWELNCLMECHSRLPVIGSKDPGDGAGSENKNHLMHVISKLHSSVCLSGVLSEFCGQQARWEIIARWFHVFSQGQDWFPWFLPFNRL